MSDTGFNRWACFFDDLELRKPDFFLEAAGQTAAETIGLVIARADAVLRAQQPNAVLVLGDANLPKIAASDVLTRLGLAPREYYVFSAHRCHLRASAVSADSVSI